VCVIFLKDLGVSVSELNVKFVKICE